MNLRKLSCFILALAIIFAMGCGKSKTETPEIPDESSPPSTVLSPADQTDEEIIPEPAEAAFFPLADAVTLSYFTSLADAIMPYVDDYNNSLWWWQELNSRTNVDIEWQVYPSNECATQLMISVAANDTADLLNVFTSYSGGLSAALDDGVIIDLAPYMDTYLSDYKAACETETVYANSAYSKDGSVPQVCHFYSTDRGPDRGMMMRGDWLDDLNIDPSDIITYDDWHDVLTKFKVEKGASDPCWLSFYGSPMHSCLAAGYGVAVDCFFFSDPYINRDGTAVYTPLEPEFLDYMNMMQTWYAEDLLYHDYVSGAIAFNDSEMLTQGKVGAFMQYATNMTNFDDIMSDDGDYYIVGVSNPRLNAEDELHISPPQAVYESEGLCVSTCCEEPEVAMRWLNYFWTEEGHEFANYGVEGVSFDRVDGKPTFGEAIINDPNGIGIFRYTFGQKLAVGIEEFTRTFSTMNEYQLEGLERWADNAPGDWNWPDSAMLSSEESEKYSAVWSDIFTLTAEFINKYITGEYGEADYEEFCGRVKEMGIDKCVAIKQGALDRYLGK